MLVFGALLIGAIAALVFTTSNVVTRAPLAFVEPPREPLSSLPVDTLRERGRAESDCRRASELWWAVIEQQPDDLEAYKAIARCDQHGEIDTVVDDATNLFEQSRVLGIVPDMLDVLNVRDVVPILNEVQADRQNDVVSLRRLGLVRRELGDVEGAVGAFRRAVELDPEDVELGLQVGYSLVDLGRIDEARVEFRNALAHEGPTLRMTRLYAIAVAFPYPFVLLVTALAGLAASLGVLRRGDSAPGPDGVTIAWVSVASLILGAWFIVSGDRMAFGVLLLIAAGSAGWLALRPLRGGLVKAASGLGVVVSRVATGQIHPLLRRLPWSALFAILAASTLAILVFVPRISNIDLRMGAAFLSAMLLFSTIGSLLLRILDDSPSLQSALRWLGIAGTLPFPLFFLYFERRGLLAAAVRGSLDADLANRLAGYGLVWAAGLGLAVVLARILAASILDPLGEVIASVERVRNGDFEAHPTASRRDEIGTLGRAMAEMAVALKQRDELKATFRRYVNPGIAERLMAGDASVKNGRLVHATVLFCDVRGFTSMSERLSPAQVVDLLNEYFSRMEPVIRRWGGVVDKFLGDGMLVVWDVPEPLAQGPFVGVPGERLAVEAALDMLDALAAFNEEIATRGLPPMQVGIGINAGELIAGPVGSRDRQEYTVMGDTVNTAQRVESTARGDKGALLVTESVEGRVRDAFLFEAQQPVALKGKAAPMLLFAVHGRRGEPLGSRPARPTGA